MNIDKYLLEDIEYKEHPSEFETTDEYSILILRLPEFKGKDINQNSLAFVIKEEIVYIYERETKEFKKLGNLSKFSDFLDDRLDALIKHLQRYHIELDNLEDELYENHINSNFISKWLQYKKDITLISRLTFHASLAFELFVNHQRKKLKKESFFHNDNLEHIRRIENLAKSSLEKLDYLYNFYRTIVDEKMNKNVYILTIISGVFLPLTLITGYFGMNTGGLPYVNDNNGTFQVTVIALLIEVVLMVGFLLYSKKRS